MHIKSPYLFLFCLALVPQPTQASAGDIPKLVSEGIYQGFSRLVRYDSDFLYRLRQIGLVKWQETHTFQKPWHEEAMQGIGEVMRESINNIQNEMRSGRISAEEGRKRIGEIVYNIGTGVNALISNFAEQMLPNIGKLAAILVTAYGGVIGFRLLKAYLIMYFNQPKLLRKVLHPNQINQNLSNLHYTNKTKEQIQYVIDMAKNTAQNPGRATFENIMLWGDPGTGKTAIVEIIAKEADMTLFVTSGGDFAKLRGKDLEQIDTMFRQARENRGWIFRRRVIIFIDEMEELFGSRARDNLSEDARNVLTKLLVELSSPNSDILFIGATNRPEDLDEAMFRRLPQQIEVGLPDREGRKAIFKLYFNKLFMDDANYSNKEKTTVKGIFDEKLFEHMADIIGDIAPAEIEDTMIRVKNRSLIYNKGIPTKAIIDQTVQEKLIQLKNRAEGFVRSSTKAKRAQTNLVESAAAV